MSYRGYRGMFAERASLGIDPDITPILLDVGSYRTKFCMTSSDNSEQPLRVFNSVVGRARQYMGIGMDIKDVFVGDEVLERKHLHRFKYPIHEYDGNMTNFNDLEKIFHHTFYDRLRISPEEHSFFMADITPPTKTTTPKKPGQKFNRGDSYIFNHIKQKLTSIMFETFNVAGLSIIDPAVAAVYLSGSDTGCVLEIGHSVTKVVPVYNGLPLTYATVILEDPKQRNRKRISGDLISDIFLQLLSANERYNDDVVPNLRAFFRRYYGEQAKEECSFVTLDPKKIHQFKSGVLSLDHMMSQKSSGTEKKEEEEEDLVTYSWETENRHVSDESKRLQKYSFKIGEERFLAPEILFHPSLIGYDLPGVHHLVNYAIQKCPEELREVMYDNIVLSGGSSMIKNFPQRFRLELRSITRKRFNVVVVEERGYGGINGMKRLISSQDQNHMNWMSKYYYDEVGPSLVDRMCSYSLSDVLDHKLETLKWIHSDINQDEDVEERTRFVLEETESKNSFRIKVTCLNDIVVGFKSLLFL